VVASSETIHEDISKNAGIVDGLPDGGGGISAAAACRAVHRHGGTIAMKADPVTRGVVPAISGDDVMQTVPDAGKYATIPAARA
jgi:hypothetical protein